MVIPEERVRFPYIKKVNGFAVPVKPVKSRLW